VRIATSGQMAAIDKQTIGGGVAGLELMERAGQEIVYALLDYFPDLVPPSSVAICCGKGNNGGDGLVVARILAGFGFDVTVMMLGGRDELSADAGSNFVKLPTDVEVIQAEAGAWSGTWLELSAESDLLIDAIFGTGIKPPLRGEYIELFQTFGDAPVPVVSLDIPSGVDGDDGRVEPVAVRADLTVSVGLPKLGLLMPPGRDHTGELTIVDIGFPAEICDKHTDSLHYLTHADYARLLPERPSDAYKYSAGTCLLLAGSRDYGGAALLAGMGTLRSGCGLLTLALPDTHSRSAVTTLPEAVVRALPTGDQGGLLPLPMSIAQDLLAKQKALAVGPGLGRDPQTDDFLTRWLTTLDLPMVVDADGLNAFARSGRTMQFRAPETIITPHEGELARLTGLDVMEIRADRVETARRYAAQWQVILVLKGSPTLIAHPDGTVVLNPVGNDALAHGGTGDVLTGLIGGLLAQGTAAFDAAALGCWLHGRAGEIAALGGSRRSVLAREVAESLSSAFHELENGWSREVEI
jgi:ADP-dependent NAD(P)H-hydrate dehydratase / NAD(P)H-hydrate epimerase